MVLTTKRIFEVCWARTSIHVKELTSTTHSWYCIVEAGTGFSPGHTILRPRIMQSLTGIMSLYFSPSCRLPTTCAGDLFPVLPLSQRDNDRSSQQSPIWRTSFHHQRIHPPWPVFRRRNNTKRKDCPVRCDVFFPPLKDVQILSFDFVQSAAR